MKYSSTSSLGFNPDVADVAPMGFLSVTRLLALRALEIAEHVDAPDHNVLANLVHVEGGADRPEHEDGERPAQVLAELVQAAEHRLRVTLDVEVLLELRNVDAQPQRRQHVENPPPIVLGQ